mgnify:CR=1 FL=1
MSTVFYVRLMFNCSTLQHRTERHDGDFGNLRQTNNGIIDTTFNVRNMMLVGDRGIMGRSVVVSTGSLVPSIALP